MLIAFINLDHCFRTQEVCKDIAIMVINHCASKHRQNATKIAQEFCESKSLPLWELFQDLDKCAGTFNMRRSRKFFQRGSNFEKGF